MSIVNDLDDLCDFTKIAQRWKQAPQKEIVKQPSPSPQKSQTNIDCTSLASSKSNIWNKENTLTINDDFKKPTITNKVRNHAPQVIDEDTEQFKIKLEHLMNVFKNEATSEFMQMKRSMLEDQKMTIKQETEKYLQMYEQKSDELTKTKEQLAEQIRICNILTQRDENIASQLGKMKQTYRNNKLLRQVMKCIKENHQIQKRKRLNKEKAIKQYQKVLQRSTFHLWLKQFNIDMRITIQEKMKIQQQYDLDIIMEKMRKEQQLLETRLKDATDQLDEANKIKMGIQENLKRAFMRGVCALNFEAMNVLNGNTQNVDIDNLANNLLINPIAQNNINAQLNETLNLNESTIQKQPQSPPKNITFTQQNRIETNEHRWKDAPLLGFKQIQDISEHQSMNMSVSKLVQQDDFQLEKEEENEGKVIKVNIDQPQQIQKKQSQPIHQQQNQIQQQQKGIKQSKTGQQVQTLKKR